MPLAHGDSKRGENHHVNISIDVVVRRDPQDPVIELHQLRSNG